MPDSSSFQESGTAGPTTRRYEDTENALAGSTTAAPMVDDAEELTGGDALPGFRVPVARLFD